MTLENQGSSTSRTRFTMRQIFMNQTFTQQQNNQPKDSSVYTNYRKLVAVQKKSYPKTS